MKTLLILALVVALAYVAYQGHQQELALQTAQTENAEHDAEMQKHEAEAQDKLKAAQGELLTTQRERDDARQQVVAANAEIARLTQTTPRPVTWFDKRVEESSARLTNKPSPAGGMRKPGDVVAPPPQR